jgi:predicted metal-binding membrane protein
MTAAAHTLDRILRRDRILVLAILVIVVLLAWLYLLVGAGIDMLPVVSMDASAPWSIKHAGLILIMWVLMMAAMMLPSAAPMFLLFTVVSRNIRGSAGSLSVTGVFVLGYVCIWTVFALIATGVQWGLDRAALLSSEMAISSGTVGGALFVGAGVYQLLPIKQACLRHCRSALEFLTAYWCPGATGALRMGLRHGAFCLGCCWLMMALLFVGGLMNILWIAALAMIVFVEKVRPGGIVVGRLLAFGLIAWGAGMIWMA